MLTGSLLCSQSHSYLLNYRIQSELYNGFYRDTEDSPCSRMPALGVWTVSGVVTIATRTAGIAETILKGSGYLIVSPFTDHKIENATIGLSEIFCHTPKNMLRLIVFPLEFVGGVITILIGPKSFTIRRLEYIRVDLLHAEANTIHSQEHKDDIAEVGGIAYSKFIAYQRRTRHYAD